MNNDGFTIIELLFALVILAISVLALAGLQIASTRGNFFSNNLTQATYLAQDRLEYLKNVEFKDAVLSAGTHSDGPITITVPGSYSSVAFTRSHKVTDHIRYKEITCTISWNDGTDHTILISTIR